MRFVFVMDTLDRVNPEKDTSFAFIAAAEARGHEALHARIQDLSVLRGAPSARVRRVRTLEVAPFITLDLDHATVPLADVDAVFIRKDPPFDAAYLYATLLLEHARGEGNRRGPVIVNDPRGLRDANEKLYAMNFSDWTPTTLVTADRDAIFEFVASVGGNAVIKPLDGAGGSGVMMLRKDDKNARAIVDVLTYEGARLAMVQEFLPSVTEGDKRVLLLDGEPLGAILRVPRGDDLRSNIHVGGSVVPTELTAKERELVKAIAPRLRRDGLIFVGLDVIGERLTEVNVTSPTGIQELGRFTNTKPADKVIQWVEAKRGA
ncbi:MAG: glutathione synthase [Polyangiaceae bacterium]